MSGRGTSAEALGRSRAARFVGRAAEQAMFAEILSGQSMSRMVWIHGPGGVGKSALTHAFRRPAASAGGSGRVGHRERS